jgi:hypothetical protein
MSHERQTVTVDRPHQVAAKGPPRRAERFPLDYASWRAHLAAPGSHFEPAPPASPRIIHLDTVIRSTVSTSDERRTA